MVFPRFSKVILLAAGLGIVPPDIPASEASQGWACFFDEGSASLSERCKLVVGSAAEHWALFASGQAKQGPGDVLFPGDELRPKVPPTNLKIEVWASAGDNGDPEVNRQLSLRRAMAVADELSSQGVPQRFVVPVGFGQDRLIVSEKSDAQNRSVWIVFR